MAGRRRASSPCRRRGLVRRRGASGAAAPTRTTVRITSPLGRTGVPGVIRVVAQVQTAGRRGVLPVRFFVDGVPIGADDDGPPYAVEWTDENPYEAPRDPRRRRAGARRRRQRHA